MNKIDPPTTPGLAKSPTGITGPDEITGGGLPAGRPPLVSGSARCGKTMLAVEFLVRGATQDGETGVFTRPLFGWLKARGMTAIITGERGGRDLRTSAA